MPPPSNPLNALPAHERAGALQRIISDLLQASAERDALRSVNATLCKQIEERDATIAALRAQPVAVCSL